MTSLHSALPADWPNGTFIGRLDLGAGPSPIIVQNGRVRDISHRAPTVASAISSGVAASLPGHDLGNLLDLDLGSGAERALRLLSPIDLQAVKASELLPHLRWSV